MWIDQHVNTIISYRSNQQRYYSLQRERFTAVVFVLVSLYIFSNPLATAASINYPEIKLNIAQTKSSDAYFEDEPIPLEYRVLNNSNEKVTIFVMVADFHAEADIDTGSPVSATIRQFTLAPNQEESDKVVRLLSAGDWKTVVVVKLGAMEGPSVTRSVGDTLVKSITDKATIFAAASAAKQADIAEFNLWFGALIAVVAALGGGFIGAFFTYYFGKKPEKDKTSTYRKKIISLVKQELAEHLQLLENLISSEGHVAGATIHEKGLLIEKYLSLSLKPRYYPMMSIETRAQTFSKKALDDLESAYRSLDEIAKQQGEMTSTNIETCMSNIKRVLVSLDG